MKFNKKEEKNSHKNPHNRILPQTKQKFTTENLFYHKQNRHSPHKI